LQWVNILIFAITALLLVPVVVLCAECLAALLPGPKRSESGGRRPRLAVLIPAHNEEQVLGATLSSLMPQAKAGDRVIVIADNCDDTTAEIARGFGAEVIERHDLKRRGKGYALDFGLRHLEKDAPGIVVMMDADCHVHEGAIEALAAQVVATEKPAQAVYLLERPSRPGPKDLVSALAFMVKNLVRPSGLGRLGLPCLLTGTGMAFPWPVIRRAKLASGNIVEDMQLGLDLALAGHAPMFCEQARVTGKLPEQRRAAVSQRTRWEHGHLQTLFTQVPRLMKGAVRHRRLSALALALELAVPPLSLLVMVIGAAIGAAFLASRYGASPVATHLLLGGGLLVLACILGAWLKFGRQQLPLTSLLAAPFYVAWKVPLYFAFVFKPQKEWVRTDRSGADDDNNSDDYNDTFPATQQPAVVELCGVNVHAVTEREAVARILHRSKAGRGGVVVTPNLDHLRRCRADEEFAGLVSGADLVVADGMPLVWASRLQGTPLPGRVAGSDLISSLSAAAAKAGRSIFLLGGAPGTAEQAARVLCERHPSLKIAGTYCPEPGFDTDADRMRELTQAVLGASPDIVFVALGSPKQERLIERLRDRLPGAWWLGVGISFSFLCGDVKRAPAWMRKAGLEWVHRLTQEPGRLFKRYLVHGVPFAARLLGGAMFRGLARKLGFGRRPDSVVTVRLDSGMGSIDVEVSESQLAGSKSSSSSSASSGNAAAAAARRNRNNPNLLAGADGRGGAETVYRTFLSGFASEFFVTPQEPLSHLLRPTPGGVPDVLRHVKAVVLLGGSVRPSRLTAAIERSILDLPLEDGRSVLWHWQEQARVLRRFVGSAALPVRVLVDQSSMEPTAPLEADGVEVFVERDLSPYRGTGGVLRDLSAEYRDDDVLLVANAAQALLVPLPDLVLSLAEQDADVSLIAHTDGTPSGLMLIRCRALRRVSQTGYVDMKEQALPAIAKAFKVTHLIQTSATGMPIRTLEEYMSALQRRYRLAQGKPTPNNPFAEDRRPTFAIVEKGAQIDRDARVHDSVVLTGAVVEAGAVVVRSIVCPGGMLAAGETAIDSLVMNAEVAAR
jgi:exopolysaccharide biosynthesis WecB/TagA/CpsF family protein